MPHPSCCPAAPAAAVFLAGRGAPGLAVAGVLIGSVFLAAACRFPAAAFGAGRLLPGTAEDLVLDPGQRVLQDVPQAAGRVRADRLGVPGGSPQLLGEVKCHPLQVPDQARVRPASPRRLSLTARTSRTSRPSRPSRLFSPAAPASPAGPAGPAGPVVEAGPVTGLVPRARLLPAASRPARAGPFTARAGRLLAAVSLPGTCFAVQLVTRLPGAVAHLLAGAPGLLPRRVACPLLAVPDLS